MAFKSDAHRRLWFANRGGGGGGGGGGSYALAASPAAVAEREQLSEALSADAQARQVAKEDFFTLSPSQVRQLEKDAYFEKVMEDERYDNQAAYWRGD